ncbi:MAG: hypothetical protein QM784_28300 [Polyangiaceae bacterium]
MTSTPREMVTPGGPGCKPKTVRITREQDALVRVTVNGKVADEDFRDYLAESD